MTLSGVTLRPAPDALTHQQGGVEAGVGKEDVKSRVGMNELLDGLQESAFKESPSYPTSFPSSSLPSFQHLL